MGRTYTVPRNVKGESRILLIFTIRSFISTLIGGLIGFLFYMIFSKIGFGFIGMIILLVFAGLGYCIGALTIPDSPVVGNLRKAGR
ncbi:MAG: hypothetical protein RSC92_04570, partial [Clostridia bacterium]